MDAFDTIYHHIRDIGPDFDGAYVVWLHEGYPARYCVRPGHLDEPRTDEWWGGYEDPKADGYEPLDYAEAIRCGPRWENERPTSTSAEDMADLRDGTLAAYLTIQRLIETLDDEFSGGFLIRMKEGKPVRFSVRPNEWTGCGDGRRPRAGDFRNSRGDFVGLDFVATSYELMVLAREHTDEANQIYRMDGITSSLSAELCYRISRRSAMFSAIGDHLAEEAMKETWTPSSRLSLSDHLEDPFLRHFGDLVDSFGVTEDEFGRLKRCWGRLLKDADADIDRAYAQSRLDSLEKALGVSVAEAGR